MTEIPAAASPGSVEVVLRRGLSGLVPHLILREVHVGDLPRRRRLLRRFVVAHAHEPAMSRITASVLKKFSPGVNIYKLHFICRLGDLKLARDFGAQARV